jgi:hypothetical protein
MLLKLLMLLFRLLRHLLSDVYRMFRISISYGLIM